MAHKLTLREKAALAKCIALTLRQQAKNLRVEAEMYDCKWPISIAKNMEELSDYYLEQLK